MTNFKKALIIILLFLFIIFCHLYYLDFNNEELIVAVIDTGINEEFIKSDNIIEGFDFVDLDFCPDDINGHGTLMSDIIINTAPEAKILPVKFLYDGIGNSFIRSIAIFYAILHGADIINMSFNGEKSIFTQLVILYGNYKGVIFVGSSGNCDEPTVDYPASYEEVFAIGGYIPDNHQYYGNYGKDIDYVASAIYQYIGTEEYEVGTSISTARVSGIIAYLRSCYPDKSKTEIIDYLDRIAEDVIYLDVYQYKILDITQVKSKINSDYIRGFKLLKASNY